MKRPGWPYAYSLIAIALIVHVCMSISHYGNLYLENDGKSQSFVSSGKTPIESGYSFRARRNVQIAVS